MNFCFPFSVTFRKVIENLFLTYPIERDGRIITIRKLRVGPSFNTIDQQVRSRMQTRARAFFFNRTTAVARRKYPNQ